MEKIKYITRLEKIAKLSDKKKKALAEVTQKFAFRSNNYYQKLINWDDPEDPIRRLIIPSNEELISWGRIDVSDEDKFTKVPGLQHKYQFIAVLLVNDVCGAYCRFCFRKRLFMDLSDEVVRDVTAGIEYIRKNKSINNVLLTGGDPLVMSTRKLESIIRRLREIDHVKIIRIGSKIPAFNPFRIINDPGLLEMLAKYSVKDRRIYLMSHFNHPRELTEEALTAMELFQKAGIITTNQSPLLKGINDDPDVLGELLDKLSFNGIPPYYIFQCRPTLGNKMFSTPIEESFEIFEKARMKTSGLGKRAKLVMSHASGKIEILGKNDDHAFFRYHRAAEPQQKARFMIFKRNPNAYWYDDYEEIISEYSIENPFRTSGPE